LPSLLSYSVVKEPLLLIASDRCWGRPRHCRFVLTTGPAQGLSTTWCNRLLFQELTADSDSPAFRVGMAVNWKERVVISAARTAPAEPAGVSRADM